MVSSMFRPGKRPLASAYPEAIPVIPAISVAGTATCSEIRNGPETTPQYAIAPAMRWATPNPSPKPTSTAATMTCGLLLTSERLRDDWRVRFIARCSRFS